mgnify:CR=1 FL=1
MTVTKSFDVEFDDSVLDLAGWKNPRYEGSKLTGRFINYYNNNDITYGKNPVIENKIAAVYLGNTLIGADDEDDSRVILTGHSYVTIDRILLIDLDTDEVEIIDKANMHPIAFRRMVQRDLPEFSRVHTKLLDFAVQNNLKPQHFVKFNQGSLMKLYEYTANDYGMEDGVFGGFGVREHKGAGGSPMGGNVGNGLAQHYGSASYQGVSSSMGLFGFGHAACSSASMFQDMTGEPILSESIDLVLGTLTTQSHTIIPAHPNPFRFVGDFPSELNRYKGDVNMQTIGNELIPCTASINTNLLEEEEVNVSIGIQINETGAGNTGPSSGTGQGDQNPGETSA